MIRVLQFADIINRYDFIDTIIQFADQKHFEISVCRKTSKSNIEEPQFSESTKARIIPWNDRKGIVLAALRLAELLEEWDIDLVHAHHFEPSLVAWLATRLRRRTKLVIGRHYSDLIQNLSGPKRKYFLAIEQIMNRSANRIVVPSTMIADILTRKQNITQAKIDIVPYGFAPAKYAEIPREAVSAIVESFDLSEKFVVVSVGKLTAAKGVRYLCEATLILKESLRNLVVVFVGEGEERRFIEGLIEEKGLHDLIKLAGWRTDAMSFVAAADIVVQPTLTEAFSQVMGESMWMGKPLVITDVSGATDIITTGENGILVAKGDSAALASAIEGLYLNPELRERIAKRGKQLIEGELSIGNVVKLYEQSYLNAFN